MIFNSFNFIVVFPLLFLLYYVIPAKFGKIRNLFLLIVSYVLYMMWNPVFSLVLLGVTAISFFTARLQENAHHRKRILTIGLITTLIPLLFFKYSSFICQTFSDLLNTIGVGGLKLQGLNWAVPIGISFFTFQAISYVCDIYYKRQPVEHNFLVYALYMSFFPSILSGPINRASLILPQIHGLRKYFDYVKAVEGLKLMLWGMFMKVVVADRVGLYVDTVLPYYFNYTGVSCFVASLLYTIQIYADFGGYSLMAIGVGKLLGFELTENFCRPYFAVSITDFWHRWHISLSTWLRDYVYIPMGGSRCSKSRNCWIIFVTFLVSGIWHGANWTFIVWGLMHGVVQIIEKLFGWQKHNGGTFKRIIRIVITFLLVNFAWVFFRMPSLGDAWNVICRIFDTSLPFSLYTTTYLDIIYISFGVGLLFMKDLRDEFIPNKYLIFNNHRRLVRWIGYLFIFMAIMLTGVLGSDQFIYANF